MGITAWFILHLWTNPQGLSGHEVVSIDPSINWIQCTHSTILIWLVVGPPLWKIWKSIGMMKFPIYGKITKMATKPPTNNDQPLLTMYISWCSRYIAISVGSLTQLFTIVKHHEGAVASIWWQVMFSIVFPWFCRSKKKYSRYIYLHPSLVIFGFVMFDHWSSTCSIKLAMSRLTIILPTKIDWVITYVPQLLSTEYHSSVKQVFTMTIMNQALFIRQSVKTPLLSIGMGWTSTSYFGVH